MITYKEYCKTVKEDWGKTSPIPKEVYDFPEDPLKSMNWIDLGLPSGTLWADANLANPDDKNGLWSWDDVMESEYAPLVPTKEQMQELVDYCDWEWDNERAGMVVKNKYGKKIFLPAVGYKHSQNDKLFDVGEYCGLWSSTDHPSDFSAFNLFFRPSRYGVSRSSGTLRFSIRLVKNKT